MAQMESLAIIEEWKRKCFALSAESDDVLISMTTRLLENLSMTLMGSARSRINLALNTLKFERSNGMAAENNKDMPLLRTLLYCVIESVNGSLFDLTAMKEHSTTTQETQTEEILDNLHSSLVEPKVEQIDDFPTFPYIDQFTPHDFKGEMEYNEEGLQDMDHGSVNDDLDLSSIPHYTPPPLAMKSVDESRVIRKNKHQMPVLAPETIMSTKEKGNGTNQSKIGARKGRESMTKRSAVDQSTLTQKGSYNDMNFKERKRRAGSVPRLIGSHEDSDGTGPSMKKPRAKSAMRKENLNKTFSGSGFANHTRTIKYSDTEMECHKCEYRSRSVIGWVQHIKGRHGVSPTQAGLALRCECGHESFGTAHSFVCEISNFTVIRKEYEKKIRNGNKTMTEMEDETMIDKGDEPMMEMGDETMVDMEDGAVIERGDETMRKAGDSKINGTDLECPCDNECKFRTRSVDSWVHHLRNKHFTTPILAGVALLCKCGREIASTSHIGKCEFANFTVIRKRDGPIQTIGNMEMTPQCVLCKVNPRTAHSYAQHLHAQHKSTLAENDIYLKCSCGQEVFNISDGRGSGNCSSYNVISHGKDCNPRQFTLHKLDEK